MNAIRNAPWTAVVFAGLALIILWQIAVSGYGLLAIPDDARRTAEITLPILVLVDTLGLLTALAFLAAAFAALGLSDRSQALSLPEGSVRALIALLLITLFAIMAVFLYRQLRIPLEETTVTQYTGISEEQLAQIPSDQIIAIHVRTEGEAGAEEKVFDIDRRLPAVEAGEESQRFAQQILTAVSTLVIAVAGFYFGTRSVAVARGAAVLSLPVVRSITPSDGKQGEEIKDIEILGKNFESPKTVKLISGLNEMTFEDVSWSATKIRCKLAIPTSQLATKYELIVVNADGGEDRLPQAFEVKLKDQTS